MTRTKQGLIALALFIIGGFTQGYLYAEKTVSHPLLTYLFLTAFAIMAIGFIWGVIVIARHYTQDL